MGERIKRADVANFIRSFKGGNFDQLTRRDGTGFFQKLQKAFVYNNTGAGLEVGSPVYISGAMNELAYDELVNEYLTSGFCLTGETYAADYPDRPVAFALEPIEAGSVGECRIDGLTPAILTGYEDGLRYAKVNEDTELLAQGDASDYQIIGVSDENESGKRFAFVKPKSAEGRWNCWARTNNESVKAGVARALSTRTYTNSYYMQDGEYRSFTTEDAYKEFCQYGIVAAIDQSVNEFDFLPTVTPIEDLPTIGGSESSRFSPRYARAICDDRITACLAYVPSEFRNTQGSEWYNATASGLNAAEKAEVNDFKGTNIRISGPASRTLPNGNAQFAIISATNVDTDTESRFYGFSFCIIKRSVNERFVFATITNVSSEYVYFQINGVDSQANNYFGLDSNYIGYKVCLARDKADWRTEFGFYYEIVSVLPPTP